MKNRYLVVACACFGLSHMAMADLSIDVYKKYTKGAAAERAIVENYVGGVGKGYFWANTSLGHSKQPRLFCFDGDYTTPQFNKLAADGIAGFLKKNPGEGDAPVEMVLLMRLKELHPCN